jgi:hypothetical protein
MGSDDLQGCSRILPSEKTGACVQDRNLESMAWLKDVPLTANPKETSNVNCQYIQVVSAELHTTESK